MAHPDHKRFNTQAVRLEPGRNSIIDYKVVRRRTIDHIHRKRLGLWATTVLLLAALTPAALNRLEQANPQRLWGKPVPGALTRPARMDGFSITGSSEHINSTFRTGPSEMSQEIDPQTYQINTQRMYGQKVLGQSYNGPTQVMPLIDDVKETYGVWFATAGIDPNKVDDPKTEDINEAAVPIYTSLNGITFTDVNKGTSNNH